MTSLFKKLNLGAIEKVLVLNAPESFATELAQVEGVEVIRKATRKAEVPFAIGFAATQRDCDLVSSMAANATEGDAIVWIAYPKAASKKYKCDFNRDTGWTVLGDAGFEPVRQVAYAKQYNGAIVRRQAPKEASIASLRWRGC